MIPKPGKGATDRTDLPRHGKETEAVRVDDDSQHFYALSETPAGLQALQILHGCVYFEDKGS
jgi:hypothetical protein